MVDRSKVSDLKVSFPVKARYLPVDWWHPDVTNWIKRRTNDMSEDTKAIFWTYKYSHPFKFWLTQKLWKPLHWTLLHTNLSPPPQTSTCYLSRTMLTATHHETHISPTHKHSNDPKAWLPMCHDILKGAIFLLWRVRDGMRRIYTILGSWFECCDSSV